MASELKNSVLRTNKSRTYNLDDLLHISDVDG